MRNVRAYLPFAVALGPLAFIGSVFLWDALNWQLRAGSSHVPLVLASHGLFSSLQSWGYYTGSTIDTIAWAVTDLSLYLSFGPLTKDDEDKYGMTKLASYCGSNGPWIADPFAEPWPLIASGSPLPERSTGSPGQDLCSEILSLPKSLSIYSYDLPPRIMRRGWRAAIAPYFNRGYPVEAYVVSRMRDGPFATTAKGSATAFLVPVEPYKTRVNNYPDAGLDAMQAQVSDAVEWVKLEEPSVWARHGACDHVLVSGHDKGGRVAQKADPKLIENAVMVVNTADAREGDQARERSAARERPTLIRLLQNDYRRYTPGKDISAVCSFSLHLPQWSLRMGACAEWGPPRSVSLSFVGGSLGAVRSRVFAHLAAVPVPDQQIVHHHVPPKRYMDLMLTSRYCLHVRGTQVQSPRLIESILFGCVPVIVADSYDLPFSGILDWSAFSVRVNESSFPAAEPQDAPGTGSDERISGASPLAGGALSDPMTGLPRPAASAAAARLGPSLAETLAAADYEKLAAALCAVRRFFVYHKDPQPGDAFWMTMLALKRRVAASRGEARCQRGNATAAFLAEQYLKKQGAEAAAAATPLPAGRKGSAGRAYGVHGLRR